MKHKSTYCVPDTEQGVSHKQSNSSNNPVKIKRLGLGKAPGIFPIRELSGHKWELRSFHLQNPANVESVPRGNLPVFSSEALILGTFFCVECLLGYS